MHSKVLGYMLLLAALSFFSGQIHANEATASEGQQLFTANCAKCHGREGKGFLRLYPPLTQSRHLIEDVEQLPCIIRYGQKGEIVVNGVTFNGIMPGNERLSDADIDAIITFMQLTWAGGTTPLDVSTWLDECN